MDDWANPSESFLSLPDPNPQQQEEEVKQQGEGGEPEPAAEAGAVAGGGGFINHIISNLTASIPSLSSDVDSGGSGAADSKEVAGSGAAEGKEVPDMKAPRTEEESAGAATAGGGGIINHVISNLTGSILGLSENQKKEGEGEEDSTVSHARGLISNLVSSLPVSEEQLSPAAEEASLLISIIQD